MIGKKRTPAHRAWLPMVVVATLPSCFHSATLTSKTNRSGCMAADAHATASGFDECAAANSKGGSNGSGSRSLLEKYTFRETVRTVIEEDQLPQLPDFLEGIGLGDKLEDFYRKSVFETKYIFALNDMDLSLMGLSGEEITAIKKHAAEIRVEKDITEERLHPLLQKRNSLTYGRLLLNRSASSFEFYLAGFGPAAPVDEARLVWAEPHDACGSLTNSELLPGAIVLAERGRCSFVDKANMVARSNALALVVINNGAEGEDLFRVAASLGGHSGGGQEPKGPENMPTVLVRGSTLPSLSKALEWSAREDGGPVMARLVPLECKPGRAACEAVLPEEQQAQKQVDSGKITIVPEPSASAAPSSAHGLDNAKVDGAMGAANTSEASFEFLAATFGATLPRGQILVVRSVPEDACSPLAPLATIASTSRRGSGDGGGGDGGGGDSNVGGLGVSSGCGGGGTEAPVAVLVVRGGCSFGVKAKNVQDAGGRVIIFQDRGLHVLQNVGAPDPLAKELYIPGVFVTARAGDALMPAAATIKIAGGSNGESSSVHEDDLVVRLPSVRVRFDPDNAVGRAWGALGATRWPDDLLEARVLARQLRVTHAASPCRIRWVEDKVRQVESQPIGSARSTETSAIPSPQTSASAPSASTASGNFVQKTASSSATNTAAAVATREGASSSAAGTLPQKIAAVSSEGTGGVETNATTAKQEKPSKKVRTGKGVKQDHGQLPQVEASTGFAKDSRSGIGNGAAVEGAGGGGMRGPEESIDSDKRRAEGVRRVNFKEL